LYVYSGLYLFGDLHPYSVIDTLGRWPTLLVGDLHLPYCTK